MATSIVSSDTSVEDRQAIGERARDDTPLSSQADWEPAAGRPDPVELLIEQNATREADLVPVRHGRMTVSPFTFYRGAARVMATDLATTPMAGLVVQLCGDAHLSNFGLFASPERELLFGLNDFDETLPGPFEYDLKRMAASFTIAARNNGFIPADARAVTVESVKAYRLGMAEFAAMRTLDTWYAHMTEQDIEDAMRAVEEASVAKPRKGKTGKKKHDASTAGNDEAALIAKAHKRWNKTLRKAHTRDSLDALTKFAEVVDGRPRIVSRPPVIIPLRDLAASYEMTPEQAWNEVEEQFRVYKATLTNNRRQLLDRFTIVDMARKVVGVGSVGTRAFMVLLQGRDNTDPLFLQLKEATSSVLEDHLPKSRYNTPGRRVVEGQRLLQAASDIFLGWTRGAFQANRHYYWRQLRDMKGSAPVERMSPVGMRFYARMCGWTLARAHARSGDPIAIAEYLGTDDTVDNAIADFSTRYANQNQRDYDTFVKAITDGRIQAVTGI